MDLNFIIRAANRKPTSGRLDYSIEDRTPTQRAIYRATQRPSAIRSRAGTQSLESIISGRPTHRE
jgi:hypothetical protein